MLSAAGKSITRSTTWHPPNFATDQPQNQHASCIFFFPIPLSVAFELLKLGQIILGTFNEGVSHLPNITENGALLERHEQHGEEDQGWLDPGTNMFFLPFDLG